MKIQIVSRPKSIALIGNPMMLQESEEDLENDPMDYLSEKIDFSDLVFTLRNNKGKYLKPFVVYRGGKLLVISNKTFFRAVSQAGLEKINFDLQISPDIPLEQLMQTFYLELLQGAVKKEYLERFLFFRQQPRYFQYSHELVIPNPNNFSSRFQEHDCLAYKILIQNPKETKSIENELIAALINQNSYLRSIDGIIV